MDRLDTVLPALLYYTLQSRPNSPFYGIKVGYASFRFLLTWILASIRWTRLAPLYASTSRRQASIALGFGFGYKPHQ